MVERRVAQQEKKIHVCGILCRLKFVSASTTGTVVRVPVEVHRLLESRIIQIKMPEASASYRLKRTFT